MPLRRSPNGAGHTRPQPGRDRPEQVVAINRNAWSQSIGTGGRNQPVRASELVDDFKGLNSTKFYVVCFSEGRDRLSQWRGYGRDGRVALGFDRSDLNEATSDDSCSLSMCRYDRRSIEDALVRALDRLNERCAVIAGAQPSIDADELAHKMVTQLFLNLLKLAPTIKHPAFREEAEWRLVKRLGWPSRAKPQFMDRSGILKPFTDLGALTIPGKTRRILPLRSVWIGPSPHSDLNMAAMSSFLETLGYGALAEVDPMVRLSTIPYRPG